MEFNYGHLLEVGPSGSLNRYRFQNFAIDARLRGPGEKTNMGLGSIFFRFPGLVRSGIFTEPFLFLPFSFGGAIATLSGDNLDATLQFANTKIARNFVVEALDNNYVAKVQTVLWSTDALVPPYAPGGVSVEKVLYEYFGSCSAGGWDETRLQVKLNSVLDAVQTNVPGRRLRRQHVGNLPFTANVRV